MKDLFRSVPMAFLLPVFVMKEKVVSVCCCS